MLLFLAGGFLFTSFLQDALFQMVFVVQDASIPLRHGSVLADPNLFGALVDESEVVANQNHAAFKVVDSVGLKKKEENCGSKKWVKEKKLGLVGKSPNEKSPMMKNFTVQLLSHKVFRFSINGDFRFRGDFSLRDFLLGDFG